MMREIGRSTRSKRYEENLVDLMSNRTFINIY